MNMMNYVWSGMLLLSILGGLLTGRMDAVAAAAMSGAAQGVTLCLSLVGMLCLWSGLMKVAHAAGVTALFARALSPLIRVLFPGVDPKGSAGEALSMSMAANFLGLGSAATPLGINAMRELARDAPPGVASDNMVMLVVLNTASIQLIPTTIAMYRQAAGSSVPFSILPAVWLASVLSVAAGVLCAKLLARRKRGRAHG